ncbi:MAG: mechanosensitive ion channel [Planctomycetes bacterium]|nr:mechanosensitive ion channel [Planctomycetota bacterium]
MMNPQRNPSIEPLRRLLLVLACCCASALAQGPVTWTVEQIEAKARAAAESTELDAATKEKVAAVFATALEHARSAAASEAAAKVAKDAVVAAPDLLSSARERLTAELSKLPVLGQLVELDIPVLDERLRTARATADNAAAELRAKDAERQRRTTRLVELPGLITAALDEITKVNATAIEGGPEDPEALREARDIRRAVRLQALTAHGAELEQEKLQYETESDLLGVLRDCLDRESAHAVKTVELIDQAIQERRRMDAESDSQAAELEAKKVHSALSPLAEVNQQITADREGWLGELDTAKADLEDAKRLRLGLESRFAEIENRIDLVGLTEAIGLQLRQEKGRLPSVRHYQGRLDTFRSKFVKLQLEQFGLEDKRVELQTKQAEIIAKRLATVPEATAAIRARIEREGLDLLQKRDEYITRLIKVLETYRSVLGNLDVEERLLVLKSRQKADYINERVLWIRSAVPIWQTSWPMVGESFDWFASSEHWGEVWTAFQAAIERSPVDFAALTLLALILIGLARPVRQRIVALAEEATNSRSTSFRPTIWTLLATIMTAIGWPLLLWHLATLVMATPNVEDFPNAVANGVLRIALLLGALNLFRQAMRPSGLAEAHLRWPAARTKLFRSNMNWFVPMFLLLAFLLRVLAVHGHVQWGFALDRLLLVTMLLVIATFLARLLHPTRGVLLGIATGGMWQRRRLWFALGVGVPVALAIVAVSGYHLSALELLYRLEQSLAVMGFAVLIDGLGIRWMLLAKRRLAMAQAKARREAAKARQAEAGPEIQGEAPQLPEESLSLASVDAQSRKLLGGGLLLLVLFALWGIWVDVLPALRAFDEFTVWGKGTDSPVSLANVLLSLVVITITVIAARNIPGLLELVVLQRMGTHVGERHAVTTLVRYLIVTAGAVFAFASIGVGWDKVQWLVAAISVGLGFGLQEIFANFVSGVIILFERPVRIGDLVTIGEVDGYVTRIRMRATTIIDFDRKEMIVPNKEFVTSRLINWTLTDTITRVVVTVGIAYGSDTELARKILLQLAADEELALDDPAPSVVFREFGASSLDFDLRVFIANRDHWPQIVNNLHSAIDREFRTAHIEIAFPQRDLHIRTFGPAEKLLDPASA